jgi:DNA repair protein RadC
VGGAGVVFMAAKRSGSEGKSGLSEASPHYQGHRERLRSRFRKAGTEAISDYELLELVLFRAIPQRDVKLLAKERIAKFGSVAEVKGLGDAAITELKIVHAAASRLAHGQVKKRPVLSSWSSVLDYCRTAMAFADKEQSACCFSTSATNSSPTNCSRSAPSIIGRFIRARWSSARSNYPRPR